MTDILCIPQKRTEDAHLKEQLAHAIELTSYQTPSFFETELDKVATLRRSISDPEPSHAKLQNLKDYWSCLNVLQKKFPDDQIKFMWFQPLSPKAIGKSSYSLIFEKLNILYNIGSLYSILALEANDGSAQALKTMCLYFQYSAGCFQHILNHLNDCKETVFDQDSGHALVYIMLSQAQECFWFKAIQDSHKDSLISKLAKQVVEFYEKALSFARKSKLIREDWCLHLESKINYFTAVTYYRNSLFLQEKKNFGAEIKSLEMALAFSKQCTLKSNSEFVSKIEETLKEVQRDNDFIYLQTIPEHLPPVKGAPMVKIKQLASFLGEKDNSIFKDLLPIKVMDACSAYNERQEVYIKQRVVEPLLSLNKLLNEGASKFSQVPNLRTISKEELESYELSLDDLTFNSNNIEAQLMEIKKILEQEFESDAELRLTYGTINWPLSCSTSVNNCYYEKLQKLEDYLEQGRKVDAETRTIFQTIDRSLIISPVKLPESNCPLIRQIESTIKSREKYAKETEAKSAEHRVLPHIISEYKNSEKAEFENVYLEHLNYFDSDIQYVKNQRTENKVLLEKLRSKENTVTSERLEPAILYIEDFQHSMKLLEDIKRNLEEGATFYDNLRKSASGLLYEVQNFEHSRTSEKQSLKSKLTSM
ncbi:RIM20 (YOR275C) [Zygosaccharomyces parabailii]|uniref:ZYBA0S08-00672g1_1 n=1 Tax=Zygosaccharomyces bailii (strain CLIB 213 / ATCC 58445 / CBS 680 / BCRC 21525 / NBRC 1098 / NCYC 1416 / NRRL Y-2227) TaxID=1333698 RepID=A0A8J2T932_ZYGB2|nr:RIM20 (YOR275C) [Zygosaccharomyces parabailii]CDF90691.1 ZYBA0S08-00672g1_1 [Zygosaccharomyces bailii CLIB 213]CDH14168.1 related to pH-response regulator protein palA/RIM20 [Zygosaccharomyces bailii ISA1307]